MRDSTIARNYAEALLSLARKANDIEGWGTMITDVANAVEQDPKLRLFLSSPQIAAEKKSAILARAFADRLPRLLVRFLQQLVKNRRQMLIPEIALEYRNLVDETMGRVHALVTVAQEPSDADREFLTTQLSRAIGKTVVPHITANPAILGGVIVRIGDKVMDGSVKRRLVTLRSRLLRHAR